MLMQNFYMDDFEDSDSRDSDYYDNSHHEVKAKSHNPFGTTPPKEKLSDVKLPSIFKTPKKSTLVQKHSSPTIANNDDDVVNADGTHAVCGDGYNDGYDDDTFEEDVGWDEGSLGSLPSLGLSPHNEQPDNNSNPTFPLDVLVGELVRTATTNNCSTGVQPQPDSDLEEVDSDIEGQSNKPNHNLDKHEQRCEDYDSYDGDAHTPPNHNIDSDEDLEVLIVDDSEDTTLVADDGPLNEALTLIDALTPQQLEQMRDLKKISDVVAVLAGAVSIVILKALVRSCSRDQV